MKEVVEMIEFIEKSRYYYSSPWTGDCWMYPVFMVKNGKEYFMFNRREPDDSWKLKEIDTRKDELFANNGNFFRFNGFYTDPLEVLAEMAERGHAFTNPDDLFIDCRRKDGYGEGFVDFHGNRNEVSAAFHYRIYDTNILMEIKKAVQLLLKKNRVGGDRV